MADKTTTDRNIAIEVTSLYNEMFGPHDNGRQIISLDEEEIEKIVKKGDLKSMVYLAGYADKSEQQGYANVADHVRDLNYKCQMTNLEAHIGKPVEVHEARFLASPSSCLKTKLVDVRPYLGIETEVMSHEPFVNLGFRSGICAVTLGDGKVLYVNPQIFNPDLIKPILEFKGLYGDPEFAKLYDALLRKTFGNRAVERIVPWLKEGNLIKA